MERALKKAGLKEIPTNPETGKWITAETKKKVRRQILDRRIFYFCPKCGKNLQFKKIRHSARCALCGQRLDWSDYDRIPGVYIFVEDSSEAAWWAEQYESVCGTVYGIDIEEWRRSLREFPMDLFFTFPDEKEYGRFMRIAGKNAKAMVF